MDNKNRTSNKTFLHFIYSCRLDLGIGFGFFYYNIAFMRRIYTSRTRDGVFCDMNFYAYKYWLNSDKLLNYDLILLINRVKSTQIAAFVKEQRFLLFPTFFSPPTLNLHSTANGTFIYLWFIKQGTQRFGTVKPKLMSVILSTGYYSNLWI